MKPKIRYCQDLYYACYHEEFRGAYGEVVLGLGDTIEEAYGDWLSEMNAHGFIARFEWIMKMSGQ